MNKANRPGCPRCDGQIYEDRDVHGSYMECISCGWMLDLPPVKTEVSNTGRDQDDDRLPGKAQFRPEAVRRRQNGVPEMLVALALGVSPRQVRRWCQGVEGIQRDDGRRWRKTLTTLTLAKEDR